MWLNALVFKNKITLLKRNNLYLFCRNQDVFYQFLHNKHLLLSIYLYLFFLFLQQTVFLFDWLQDFSAFAHFLAQVDFFAFAHFFSVPFLLQHSLFADFSALLHFLAQLDFSVLEHFCSVLTSLLLEFVFCANAIFTNKLKVSNNKILFIVIYFFVITMIRKNA